MRIGKVQFRTALFALTWLLVLWGFRSMLFDHAPHAFRSVEEDMDFAWFVPLFSLYVLWRERREIAAAAAAPSSWGLLAALPFLLVGFLGARGVQLRFEVLAFAGLVPTLTWAFYGGRCALKVLFPALFLLFCIPLNTFLDVITVHLRLFATGCAFFLLKGFGLAVVRDGTALAAADGSFAIDVAEPCSGLRSIFALMALTAGYAYFTQPTLLRRLALFACSVPLAIAGNVARVVTIALVASAASAEFATGFYHDYSGYVVFLVAISLMVAAGALITKGAERCSRR